MTTPLTAVCQLTPLSALVRIVLAIVMGGVIGLERGMKNRPAGLRTYMLVSLGACLVMMTNQYIYQAFGTGDPVRMGAQVVSGIGFLGAGTIIVTTRNQIKGLTTAAGLWAAACDGLAVGIGLYAVAVPGAVVIFLILTALHELDFRMRRSTRMAEAYIELEKTMPLGDFLRAARENGIEASNVQFEHEAGEPAECAAFIVTLRGQNRRSHDEVLACVRRMPGVTCVEEL